MRTRKQVSLAVLALLVFSSLVVAQSKSSGADKAGKQATLTGVVSDTMCGAKHMMKGKTAAECTRECVKADGEYALVVGEKVYTLKGNAADLDKYAGERVTVKGTVSGDTVTAQSIAPAKGTKGS
jgi:hypothetical protein